MPFITFIYKIGNEPNTYFGKYCSDYISDDHDGLDNEVKYSLKKALNKYREKNNIPKITDELKIGVLSFSSSNIIPTFSSNKEIKCFDFYNDYDNKTYINGTEIY
jgi:hypothetical protein